ncbi:cyclophilin-like domain-containing protein [Gilbertella persicaria]|uniref:Peptidyl-prolyl isomerase CWC27 n=1 Tax=Rhizopus stolonifer TaxID=4846 RepID=A0A367K4K4_RHIST|nr:cyclophilin-like domain-containing protein [Gilbertella persicaria]KAI8082530.1 cyclophilin-like domain-containing protein [Gilbertella persicaria]RCH97090.1 Peptidyl-prolyl isomerase cwc27 [Rhizopus stolonifer]
MSNIYALEPQTNAKVILHTTSGDIEIELWGKEAPKATRNFIQLCLEGYYDGTIFHRIVPNFIVQGGDPTGTGQGGESIYEDEGFPDEFHSRLRFNRRGLVGLANTGQNDNGSQFFITLDRADELTRKHTLFGRVAGETLFNVMKMTELELDENERPLYPPRIRSAEVVLNPFDDILPRITAEEKRVAKMMEKKKLEAEQAKKKKKGLKKQLNLLSFGEEAAELEPPSTEKTKMKSTYDFMENAAPPPSDLMQELSQPIIEPPKKEENKQRMEDKLKEKVKQMEEKRKKEKKKQQEEKKLEPVVQESTEDAIEKLKRDIRSISKPVEEAPPVILKEKKKSLVALEREKYASQQPKKKKTKSNKIDDSDVLDRLMAFTKKLSDVGPASEAPKKEQKICKLHDIPNCESCFDPSVFNDENETDEGWISHRLVFDKDLKGKDLMQRKETVDDYVVIDPRDREAQAKQEEYERKRSIKSRKRDREERRK